MRGWVQLRIEKGAELRRQGANQVGRSREPGPSWSFDGMSSWEPGEDGLVQLDLVVDERWMWRPMMRIDLGLGVPNCRDQWSGEIQGR